MAPKNSLHQMKIHGKLPDRKVTETKALEFLGELLWEVLSRSHNSPHSSRVIPMMLPILHIPMKPCYSDSVEVMQF